MCAAAAEAMERARPAAFANPASVHGPGRRSRALLEAARDQVARALSAEPADVVLTAGGTEACNLAVLGLGEDAAGQWIGSAVEHPAVLEPLRARAGLARGRLELFPVPHGRAPDPASFASLLAPETRLVAVQLVNHETGTILPAAGYAERCRARGIPCFVDATAAAGKLPLAVDELRADAVAIASHKLGGPAGAGALWVRRGVGLRSLIAGGAQERGRRAGTPDVVAAVGFGAACASLRDRLDAQPRLVALRDRLEQAALALGAVINAASGPRVPTVVSLSFRGQRGDALVAALDLEGVAASSGAACSSGLRSPSQVLLAMHGDEPWRAGASLRLSFGPETTEVEVDSAIEALRRVLSRSAS